MEAHETGGAPFTCHTSAGRSLQKIDRGIFLPETITVRSGHDPDIPFSTYPSMIPCHNKGGLPTVDRFQGNVASTPQEFWINSFLICYSLCVFKFDALLNQLIYKEYMSEP